jgi:hypothetical protein
MASNSQRNSRYSFEMAGFGGFNETTEADSAVSMIPRKQIPRFQCDRGSRFSGYIETSEEASVESLKNFNHIIFPEKCSFQHKTMSKKVWLPESQ